MFYEVFLSYSRRDLALSDKILELIQGKLNYFTFRDVDDLVAGFHWQDQVQETLLQTERRPYVVVLCTAAAQADPDRIAEELRFAREHGLTVIPIQFDPGVSKFLLHKAGFPSPGGIDYADAHSEVIEADAGCIVTSRLEDKIRRTLISHVSRKLAELRAEIGAWAEQPAAEKSFWEAKWRDYFEWDDSNGLPHSVALTARGGSGKSRLLARCVRELLQQPDIYPILIGEEVLQNAATELPCLLGARDKDALVLQIDALAAPPPPERTGHRSIRVVFVVDGLDQMIVAGDAGQRQLVAGLKLLANIAPVLIGCREEIWETYAGQVSVAAKQIKELDLLQVELLLKQEGVHFSTINPLLRIPLFLDVALVWGRQRQVLPRTATGFLRRMWSKAVSEEGDTHSVDDGRDWLLQNIAQYQVRTLSYEVPLVGLQEAPGYMPEFERGIEKLKASRMLVVKTRPGGNAPAVRLRHDLLDNYAMLRILLDGPGRLDRIQDLCRRCDKDCGWSLLALLVQYAFDQRDDVLMREIFLEFLFVLDRKRWDDRAMARAWAVTHAIRESFSALFSLIVEVLAGDPQPSLQAGDGPSRPDFAGSVLGPPALITQEAASTLANAFTRFRAGEIDGDEKAVSVIAACLEKWPLRARFIEALGKFNTSEALDALLYFARAQLKLREDIDVLLYLANGLAAFQDDPEAIKVLYDLLEMDTAGFPQSRSTAGRLSRVKRMVAGILNRVSPEKIATRPADEDEILLGLEIWDEKSGRYSDWREIERYANDIWRRRRGGESFGSAVLQALIAAMKHDQTYARRAVAQALGFFDETEAREALFSELRNDSISAEVRIACLDALGRQIARLELVAKQELAAQLARESACAKLSGAMLVEQGLLDLAYNIRKTQPMARDTLLIGLLEAAGTPGYRDKCLDRLSAELHALADARERQVLRFLMLRVAAVVHQQGDHETAHMLTGLATDPAAQRPNDWRVSSGAIEVTPRRNMPLRCHVEQINNPIDARILQELGGLDQADVGSAYELKYRFTELALKENGSLDVGLAPSSWQEGRRFHAAQLEDRKRFLKWSSHWVLPVPLGDFRLPGLAVVHAVIITADGAVVMAQRSGKVAYAPLHWSASFEEQITDEDVMHGDAVFHHAAQRGMREEFGVIVQPKRIHLISTLLQMDNLNLGVVMLLEASESLAQLRESWSGPTKPTHAWEAEALDGEVADLATLDRMVREGAWREGPLHPTSPFRLALLADWRQAGRTT